MKSLKSNTIDAAQVPANNKFLKPEFGRVSDVVRDFRICRSSVYTLISECKIRSVCLRRRGAVRGIRLIDLDSVRNYIANEMDAAPSGN